MRTARIALLLIGLALAVAAQTTAALAQRASDVRLDSAVRSLEMGPREVRADLTVDLYNNTSERRIVRLAVEGAPQGWDVAVWDRFFDFKIGEIVIEPSPTDEAGPSQSLRLRVDIPDDRPPAGAYSFGLRVTSPDGAVEYDSADYTIVVPEPPASADAGASISVTYPVLRGPSTSQFEFEIVIDNDTGADTSFDLAGDAVDPAGLPLLGWEVAFSPSFGAERLISSISVNDGLTERVDVRVTPPRNAPPGDYFVPVGVSDDAGFEAATLLQITIRGRGEVIASTDTGRLNVEATAGETTSAKMRLTNFGTADLADITLLADAPQGWEVTFDPSTSPPLPVNNQIDIPVSILPAADAIPGDYLITLRANHPDTSDSVDLRVTVAQSTIWGWLGIVLVVLVIGGLGALFWRLGRR